MNMRSVAVVLIAAGCVLLTSCDSQGSGNRSSYQSEDAIKVKEQVDAYVNAVNKRDTDQAVKYWSEKAVYRNPVSGHLSEGKPGIKKEMQQIWEEIGDVTYEIDEYETRFPVEDKAVIEGIAKVTASGKDPVESKIKMILVNENGNWLILHVSRLDLGLLKKKD